MMRRRKTALATCAVMMMPRIWMMMMILSRRLGPHVALPCRRKQPAAAVPLPAAVAAPLVLPPRLPAMVVVAAVEAVVGVAV